jgi:hypothetical protein
MVFLLLDAAALKKTLEVAKIIDAEVWLGAEAITEAEHHELHRKGHKITRFSHSLSPATSEGIEDALLTIKEHHPAQVIWVQHVV